jgi:hypothetical protein
MPKEFKYRALMSEDGIAQPCPFHDCKELEIPAYHFGYSTKENADNFMPSGMKRPVRKNDPQDINCKRCGLSMYKSFNGARDQWEQGIPARIRTLLGYTHLYIGELKKDLGMVLKKGGNTLRFLNTMELNFEITLQFTVACRYGTIKRTKNKCASF